MTNNTIIKSENGKVFINNYWWKQQEWVEVDPNKLPTKLLVGTGIAICEAILNYRLNLLGGSVIVKSVPDWSGGHDYTISYPDWELGDYEYKEALGSPRSLLGTTYMAHIEPLHEEARDILVLFEDLIDDFLCIRTI